MLRPRLSAALRPREGAVTVGLQMHAPAATMPCPSCGTPLPVLDGYVTWCHACGWHLTVPPQPDLHETRTTRIADAIGRRLGDRMAAELARAHTLEPRWTPTKIAAYALAGLVHAASLALAVAGVALAVLAWPNVAA